MKRIFLILYALLFLCGVCFSSLLMDFKQADKREAAEIMALMMEAVPEIERLHQNMLKESEKYNSLEDPFRHKMYFVEDMSEPYLADIEVLRGVYRTCRERADRIGSPILRDLMQQLCLLFRTYYVQIIAFPVKSNDWDAIYAMYDRYSSLRCEEFFAGAAKVESYS